MITKDNLVGVLETLHYLKTDIGNVYIKEYPLLDCQIKVDFDAKEITYPEEKGMKIHRKTTCNFSENENFVILECITSLLDKGYKPTHIELEKPMPGGHDDTGGYCDIQVKDNYGRTFLLIECKKADEFDKFWKKTLSDGGQLFRYYNSFRQAKALCLYTSDYNNAEIKRTTHIISMEDNMDYLSMNKKLKGFKKVQEENGNKEDYFDVWKNTYQLDYSTQGIFEDSIDAYTIGKLKHTDDDLIEVDNDSIQKKYHEFATILRQHNVGSHENAFDKLVNLFLTKIVDETINPRELQFHWKGAASDDFYSLQDRLQKLYKVGMEKFLGEKVTYIDQHEVNDAFRLFKNDPDATRAKILEYFRQLKFYTNNDFAFLDVHNEELFFQNAIILKKIVKMLEDIRLKTGEQNQFLGDLFEGFLDDGVKQSEGQFFTPLPIVKFLVSSLPLEQIVQESEDTPKAIDYACGAGHFLTEYASCIRPFVEKSKRIPVSEYYANTYGIEKEYRLSKVSKVSAFMYGQDDIQIIYGDALATNSRIKDGVFSVLIANPPYSVKGFLETLSEEERNKYVLTKAVADISKNNSIETFFVERAKQLLKGKGVAAIILPSSILSNGNIYISCREMLLKYFDIVAIAEMSSGTFSKTGTNTATMFLQRKADNPSIADHYKNRIDAWFRNDHTKDVVFEDEEKIAEYCEHCGIDALQYTEWLKGGTYPEADVFVEYEKKAKTSSRYKQIDKKKETKKHTKEIKEAELESYVDSYIRGIEKDKLYYYLLAASNPVRVIVVKSPSGKTIKNFLGYEWSGAKGNEGIKYLGTRRTTSDDGYDTISANRGINSINTPLFDPADSSNPQKINYIIRSNYLHGTVDIPHDLEQFVTEFKLVDMIDFSGADFTKQIRLTVASNKRIKSKYPVSKLGRKCDIRIGGTPSRKINEYFTGENLWVSISEMQGQIITDTREKITDEAVKNSNVKLIPAGTTLLSFKLSIGKTAIAGRDLYTNEAIAALIPRNKEELLDKYLFYLFKGHLIDIENVGNKAFGKSLNSTYLNDFIEIPVPPIFVQEKIITECQSIDEEYKITRMSNNAYHERIKTIFEKEEVFLFSEQE